MTFSGGGDASLSGGGHFISGTTNGLNIVMDDNEIMARNNGASSTLFLNKDGGCVGIGGSNSSYSLYCNGSAAKPGVGVWTTSSDFRLKDINEDFDRSISALMQLNPVKYNYESKKIFFKSFEISIRHHNISSFDNNA